MSKNKKDKNLNEKEIEKVSGGKQAGGCIICPKDPWKDRWNPEKIKAITEEILKSRERRLKKEASSPSEVKNLQPFPDEDKN